MATKFRRKIRQGKQLLYTIEDALVQSRVLQGGDQYQPFILLSRSRTGSTLIDKSLRLHPEVCMDGEILNRLEGRNAKWIIDNFFSKRRSTTNAAGFKVFYYHPLDGDPDQVFNRLLKIENLKIIHLKRKNRLAVELSRKIADLTDKWSSSQKGGGKNEVPPVKLDIEDCRNKFEETKNYEQTFDALFKEHDVLEVIYEEMVADQKGQLERLHEWLGVAVIHPEVVTKKQSSGKLKDRIENYGELKSAFRGSEWEHLFE